MKLASPQRGRRPSKPEKHVELPGGKPPFCVTVLQWTFCLPLLVLLLVGCSNPNQKMEILPMTMGDWKRMAVENIPAEEHTEELKRMGIKRARRAIYQNGEQRVTIAVYEYGAGAAAFEMVQKWRPQPGKIVTSQGPFFVILESQTVDATALNRVASLIEGILRE